MSEIWFDTISKDIICDITDDAQFVISFDKMIKNACECTSETVETDLDSKEEMIEHVDNCIECFAKAIEEFKKNKEYISSLSEFPPDESNL